MTFAIDTDVVEAVLLVDGWHPVQDQTFQLGVYTFAERDQWVSGEGPPAARWTEPRFGTTIVCPITAVLALRCRES
jgi:hypothetical protein